MATPKKTKGGKAANKQEQAANEQAINLFPRAVMIEKLNTLAEGTGARSQADADAASASLEIIREAQTYGAAAHDVCNGDTSTVLKDWRENIKLVALELAASGSPFAESRTTDDGTVAKLTGTGNNVMSIAKGVVDFKVAVDECLNDEGIVTYRTVRTAVESMRAARKLKKDPAKAALAAAKNDARESWLSLSKLVFATDDMELIHGLAATITELEAVEQDAQAIQIAMEAHNLAEVDAIHAAAEERAMERELAIEARNAELAEAQDAADAEAAAAKVEADADAEAVVEDTVADDDAEPLAA